MHCTFFKKKTYKWACRLILTALFSLLKCVKTTNNTLHTVLFGLFLLPSKFTCWILWMAVSSIRHFELEACLFILKWYVKAAECLHVLYWPVIFPLSFHTELKSMPPICVCVCTCVLARLLRYYWCWKQCFFFPFTAIHLQCWQLDRGSPYHVH